MSPDQLLALRGILASINQLTGAALALLRDADASPELEEALSKIHGRGNGLPPMFGPKAADTSPGKEG